MDTTNSRITGKLVVPEEQLGQHFTLVVPGSPPPQMQCPTPPISTGQSGGHRTRKEKLICRSVTDSSVSTSVSTILNQESPSEEFKHAVGSNVSPSRKSLKRISPTTPRPYRKKHGAVPVKSIIDPLNREAYEMTVKEYKKREKANQQQPRIAKRPYKRRIPLTPPVSPIASGEVQSSLSLPITKTKPDHPIKNLVSGSNSRHLSTSTSNIQHEHGSVMSSATTPSSSSFNSRNRRRDPYELLRHHLKDKKSPYLPVFGSPNVMPIFRPGQKPWLLLNSLMNGTEKNNSENQTIIGDQKGKVASSGPTDSNILKDKSSDRVDDSGKCSGKEVEIVAVPVECIDDDKLLFTAEDRLLFEYLLSTPEREQTILPNQPTITNSPTPSTASRLQAPSPSPSSVSGSSSNNGSLRRYSRRRHSSLHPAYEQDHCLYSNHTCTLPLAYGSTYCIKHVPERYSPYYVRCSFFSTQSGRRCRNLQYSDDGKKKFCDMHASRLALLRQQNSRKSRPSRTFRDDINDIKRVLEQTRRPQRSEAITYLEDLCDYKLQTQCMEYQMESKGPTDVNGTVGSLSQFQAFQAEYDSDGGVETGEQYECLKHAGFYTTEEVVRILQSKLQRLRQLYVKEFDFIKFFYLMKRREYLLAEDKLKNSNVMYTSDPNDLVHCHGATVQQYSQDMLTVKKMNSLHNYKKLRGNRAVLHHIARKRYEEFKEKEKANKTSSSLAEDVDTESESDEEKFGVIADLLRARAQMKTNCKKPKVHMCVFHEGQDKCRNVAMPAMKHCMAHILLDEKQCMFEQCTYPVDNHETCPAVILKRIDKGRCDLHRRIFVKDLPDTIKEEDKEQVQVKSTLQRATKEEAQIMLQDLIAQEIYDVAEFDTIVQDIFAKGLDCSDTDHTFSGSDDDEEGHQGCRRKKIGRPRTVNER